jgi:hypothetical protein
MPRQKAAAIVGSLVLFLGVFAPIVSMPFAGTINYFQNGRGDGVVLLVLAAISFLLALIGIYRALYLTGAAALAVLLFTFVAFQRAISTAHAEMARELAGNPFAGVAGAMLGSIQLQWGWAVLVIGAGLLITSALAFGDPVSTEAEGRVSSAAQRPSPFELAIGATLVGLGLIGGYVTERRLNASPAAARSPARSEFAEDLRKAKAEDSSAAKRAYLGRVQVSNLRVAESVLGGLGVFGEVRNGGDRSLDEVEITIYFLDGVGRPIHETTYRPVFVSDFSFDPDVDKPLKPGYSRKFGVRADDAPSAWSQRVQVRVTAVEFSK